MIASLPHICNHSHLSVHARVNRVDPTKTLGIQNRFVSDFKRRFKKVTREIIETVVSKDVFGMRPTTYVSPREFAFLTSPEKINAFMAWLNMLVENEILQVGYMNQLGRASQEAWTNIYVLDSYKRGVLRARYEMKKAGYDVPSIEQTGGIEASMSLPFHIDRVGLLYIRAFNELKGITSAMDVQISKVLAQGMIDGDGPRMVARKLVKTITGIGEDLGITDTLGRYIPAMRRAEMLARTEMIRAHHIAMIQEYRNWELSGVYVLAEFLTAGDDRVCPICAGIEAQGKEYTLDEAEGLIPVHPQCRCICLPISEEIKQNRLL